ncbi:hypothetical protein CC80DRAFT_494427 [Byssothecium circinans]|uniref:Uncharacterized protein n=1 Tax=Byssothecium circinans TaxID=147558 RepID=A0A6A5TNJ1_9PLEO|nr:hypothetical protein CC80DRAFT_494427 [Byssothecium circinans]
MVKNLAREDRSRAIAEMEIKRGKKAGKKRVSKWQSMKSFLGLPQKSAETAEEETPSDSE